MSQSTPLNVVFTRFKHRVSDVGLYHGAESNGKLIPMKDLVLPDGVVTANGSSITL